MAGLFDTLSLGSRSLSTYRQAIDTTGHNLANVNTPGYTRQRLVVETTTSENGTLGSVGTGAEAVKIVRLQNEYAEKQLQVESSIEGSLTVKHDALQQALTSLQESIDRNGVSGTSTQGISQDLAEFFAAAQSLSTNPSSIAERQVLIQKAQELATKFNAVDSRLATVQGSLNDRVAADTGQANTLLVEIANLNEAIVSDEVLSDGYANDLRDTRQHKLEALSKLIKIDVAEQLDGSVNVSVAGNLLVEGRLVNGTLETFDAGGGALSLRISGQANSLSLTGGSIHGAITVRDGQIATLREEINALAASFITEVNQAHSAGFSLTGSTGANLFVGSNAADIAVNEALRRDPALVQAAGVNGEAGDNTVALAIAHLSNKTNADLNNQTFSNRQSQIVLSLGQEVSNARNELEDQSAISQFIRNQRDSVSGVSVDEEMSNLIMFQKAFQASARLISMTDEMLATIIEM